MMEFFYHSAGIEPDPQLLLGKRFADNRSLAQTLLQEAVVVCERIEIWENQAILDGLSALAEHSEVKRGDFLGMVRIAVTGRSVSPPLTESMEILGRERCVLRLREAVNAL